MSLWADILKNDLLVSNPAHLSLHSKAQTSKISHKKQSNFLEDGHFNEHVVFQKSCSHKLEGQVVRYTDESLMKPQVITYQQMPADNWVVALWEVSIPPAAEFTVIAQVWCLHIVPVQYVMSLNNYWKIKSLSPKLRIGNVL